MDGLSPCFVCRGQYWLVYLPMLYVMNKKGWYITRFCRANKRTHPRILMGAPVVTDPTLGESLYFVSESYLTGSYDICLTL